MIANDIKDRPGRVTAPNRDAHPVVRDLRPSERRSAAFRRPPVDAWPNPNSENALVRKLGNFIPLSRGELHCLADLQSKSEEIASNTDLAYEGKIGQRAYILQSGWAYCYKLLPDGGRQVITFSVPGDILGMRNILLRASDHSFATVTDSVASPVAAADILRMFADYPRLAQAILWSVSRDEAIAVEHLVSLGRRSAIERTAHFFLELKDRLWLAGISGENGFECPLNQYLLSDALGLTAVHLNRVLRQLRERGLMTVKDNRVVIDDVTGLVELAGYDNAYLDQPRPLIEAAS
jgi:CRP-like cAMP-binding protein